MKFAFTHMRNAWSATKQASHPRLMSVGSQSFLRDKQLLIYAVAWAVERTGQNLGEMYCILAQWVLYL